MICSPVGSVSPVGEMTEMKTKILQILRNTDGYVSGQQLCDELGVSRTAVWKVINQLKEEGYEIEAVRNKGYHILEAAGYRFLDKLSDH